MDLRIDLHSSARENIKWPLGKLIFVVHGGQFAPLFLVDLPPLLIIPF